MTFGQTIREMEAMKPSIISNAFYSLQILSDAYDGIKMGYHSSAITRQLINKAKYFIRKDIKEPLQ